MYVCMYVCICIYVCMYAYIYMIPFQRALECLRALGSCPPVETSHDSWSWAHFRAFSGVFTARSWGVGLMHTWSPTKNRLEGLGV